MSCVVGFRLYSPLVYYFFLVYHAGRNTSTVNPDFVLYTVNPGFVGWLLFNFYDNMKGDVFITRNVLVLN